MGGGMKKKYFKIGVTFIILSFVSFAALPQQKDLAEELVSLKFKDVDIKLVLEAIGEKATKNGKPVNIVIDPEVEGVVNIDLKDVHWERALKAILGMYNYSYEWIGDDILLITTLDKLAEKRKKEAEAAGAEPLETITYKLKFLDARDVKKAIDPQLTPRGKITVVEIEPQKGWKARGGFGIGTGEGGEFGRAEREAGARPRTNTLIITDAKSNIPKIIKAIEKIDVMPKQILIEAKIMEISRDWLKDIGLDYATGSTGVSSGGSPSQLDFDNKGKRSGGGFIKGNVTPSIFGPESSDISGVFPYNAGLEFIFRKLTGAQFEAILHALEEDVHTNVLSAPRVLTLDGQEAYIMVGDKRPIVKSSIESSQISVGISKELDYYQNLGIELNVVPQISDDNYINMIIYPSVTSSSQDVNATSQIGSTTSTDSFPIINVREAQTQVLVKDGDTIAIGGLLKDVKKEGIIKTPILGDIPFLGALFRRKTYDTEKIDLVIFLTVRIIDPKKGMLPLSLYKDNSFKKLISPHRKEKLSGKGKSEKKLK